MNKCVVCDCEVIPERAEFLLENNKEMTCLQHAQPVKLKAIYSGEHGTSELIFCDRVYNDSVRSKLYNTEQFVDDEELNNSEDQVVNYE